LTVPALGTDVLLEYEWVRSADAPGGDGEDTVQESVAMRLRQAVPGLQAPGDWRVLLGVQVGSIQSGGTGGERAADMIEALNRRVSAGVSVAF
jgi:hypothetical protein